MTFDRARSLLLSSTAHEARPRLALAGGAGLLLEWFLFGRFRRAPASAEVAHR